MVTQSAVINRKLEEALALHRAGQLDMADVLYRELLAADPNNANVYHLLGLTAQQRKNYGASADRITQAIALNPTNPRYHVDLASALMGLNRLDEAQAALDQAVEVGPTDSDTWFSRGVFLARRDKTREALESINRAMLTAIDDRFIHAYRGKLLQQLGRVAEAAHGFAAVLAAAPDDADAHYSLGLVQQDMGLWPEALDHLNKAYALTPDAPFLAGKVLFNKMQLCDWSNYDDTVDAILAAVDDGREVIAPRELLYLPATVEQHRACADVHLRGAFSVTPQPFAERATSDAKIRVGYFSPDFRTHNIGLALIRLIEGHSRANFEVIGFSYGPDDPDPLRDRFIKAFDQFIDVTSFTDAEVVAKARELDLDVAIDLAGYGAHGRPGIFVRRAAPLQIGLFGYPMTRGQGVLDYLVADTTVIADATLPAYAEKIIYMADIFQITDRRRTAPAVVTREQLGLDPAAFVFAAFAEPAKYNPDLFDVWLSVLRQVPHGVLWLLQDNDVQVTNLKVYAEQHGISAARLVFAQPTDHDAHMSRLAVADLVLDTLPFNGAGATIDALVAGVPVLTCSGRTFSGRMGASLLKASKMQDLIAPSLSEYEALAVRLAHSPQVVQSLKKSIGLLRGLTPVFNTTEFTIDFETALAHVVQLHRRGEAPAHLHLKSAQ